VGITDPTGRTTTRFVDAIGRVVRTSNPLGQSTTITYDAVNRIVQTSDAIGAVRSYSYDANNNLLTLTDAFNHTTTYAYDNMDRLSTRTDALLRGESYVYDSNGHVLVITDRKGQVTAYTYDALDRLTQTTYHDMSTTSHTYDAGDRLIQVVDSLAGTITRGYDGLDRLISETTPAGSISYTYDSANRRATMTVNGQPQVIYGYDDADRLTSITQNSAVVGFSYDNADRRTVLTLPNGVTVEYGYNASSDVTSLTYKLGATMLGDLTYTYDLAGHRTSVGGTWARTGLPTAVTSTTYDAANQIITFGGNPFTYDANGNLTSDGVRTFTWNARNELVSVTGTISGSFAYDGFGRRQSKTISGLTTQFLYDGSNPVQELMGGTPIANLTTGLGIDEFFTRTDGAGVRNYLTDALGSSIALADASGTVQTEYSYEPFGNFTSSGSTTTNTFTFTGREADSTGLYYYRARYYDRSTARFLNEDPLAERAGINFYSYVGNQPTRYIDPMGLAELCCRPVNMPGLRQWGAEHCFIKMSDGTTYGGYNRGGRLRPEPNAKDDRCPSDKPNCTPLQGPEDAIRGAWNALPKGDGIYGVDGTSNRIPADILDLAGIPYTMPPKAIGAIPPPIVIPIPGSTPIVIPRR
jgi:RHS repeat-associated protein